MTRYHQVVPPEQVERWRRIYDCATDIDPDWAERNTLGLRILSSAVAETLRLRYDDVLRALSRPEKFAPYADEVALARAWDWDWQVIENLSGVEWTSFIQRLASTDDPYELAASTPTTFSDSRWGSSAKDGGEEHQTPRRKAWMRLNDTQQNLIHTSVSRMRKRLEKNNAR